MRPAAVLVGTWLALSAANQHSIARWRPLTVTVLALAVPVLLGVLVLTRRRPPGPVPRWAVAAGLVGCAAAAQWGRHFSYLPPAVRTASGLLTALVALACAGLWLVRGRWREPAATLAYVLAGACLVVTTLLVVRYDPLPRIDVWYSLDQASAGLLHGRNPYTSTWYGGPGVSDAFTYLPMTAVALAPFRWLLGDVRWGLLAALLLAGRLLGRRATRGPRRAGADPRGPVMLLWLTPGQLVQSEQGWTEPLLLAALVATLVAVREQRPRAAVGALALGLATKQHLALLLPGLLTWHRFGPARVLAAAGGAGAVCLPFLLADPRAFLHDTVGLLVGYPPLPLSPNLYIAALRAGHEPPFWLTALVVLGAVAAVASVVRREQPAPARLALCWALLLLVLNLVNKQAFYNQFWLSGSLLLAALALSAGAPDAPDGARSRSRSRATIASQRHR